MNSDILLELADKWEREYKAVDDHGHDVYSDNEEGRISEHGNKMIKVIFCRCVNDLRALVAILK